MKRVGVGGVVLWTAWLGAHAAAAQTATTGTIEGRVVDDVALMPISGVTVTIDGRPQTTTTDADGRYRFTLLPAGDYTVMFFDGHVVIRTRVHVGAQQVTRVLRTIDRVSTTTGIALGRDYLTTVPIPGRTFDAALGAAPGAQGDALGTAFSGSSSPENRYLLDGGDITDLRYGSVGSTVPNEFIEGIAVLTGGENAEYGRATGGIVDVTTRSGTNELRGSLFGTLSPSWLAAPAKALPVNPTTIDVMSASAYDASLGFELGGPIVKNRLWFYVGFAPQLARTDFTRNVESLTDCRRVSAGKLSACESQYADGAPDVDPKTGSFVTDVVDSSVRSAPTQAYPVIGKLDFAATPDHQGSLGILAVPSTATQPGLIGLASTGTHTAGLTIDTTARWTSKLRDDAIELEAQLAWHHAAYDTDAIDPALDSMPQQQLSGDFVSLAKYGGESAAAIAACTDGGAGDRYPQITNCPGPGNYAIGGPGGITHDVQDRVTARFAITGRIEALGAHELKAGIELEADTDDSASLYSGGALFTNVGAGSYIENQFVKLATAGEHDPPFNQICRTPNPNPSSTPGSGTLALRCEVLGYTPGAADTDTIASSTNSAGYLRDSWRPRSDLIVDLGLRYEQQRLFYPDDARDTVDPISGVVRGDTLLVLGDYFAPRIGVTYDPTDEGRAKIFAHWGRFFEAVPMDIQMRNATDIATYTHQVTCPNPPSCTNSSLFEFLGASPTSVAPGTKAEYMDELVAGAQVELAPDFVVGATYKHRQLGRVLEDVSTNGAATYVIANPGVYDPTIFDPPTRDYNALELTAATRGSRWSVQASYTYSRTEGDYPGDLSVYSGQFDPNLSSQYDQIELLANRKSPLPQDRPHYLKLDGSYTLPIGDGAMIFGVRFRALSGTPEAALASHLTYGPNESFLLPSSALGRTPMDHSLDVHVAYRHRLPHRAIAEVFADIYNVYDHQAVATVDPAYTLQDANPIAGGNYADLIWLKTIHANGIESPVPIGRNPDYLRPTGFYAPLYAQLGFRMMF